MKTFSNSGKKDKRQCPSKCPIWSIEKGAKITQAIAPELVSLNGNKDVVIQQILDSPRTRHLLVSVQLPIKLPLLCRGGGDAGVCGVFLLC